MRKEVFESPIIKASFYHIRFPRICPVCGSEACTTTHISVTKAKGLNWGARWGSSGIKKSAPKKTLLLYVCEDHKITDEEEMNYKTLCACVNGLLFSLFFFSFFWLGSDFWLGRPLNQVNVIIGVLFFATIILSGFIFRPNPLRNSFRIVGADRDQRYLWLDLKNKRYREEFLKENAMQVELVRWIVWG